MGSYTERTEYCPVLAFGGSVGLNLRPQSYRPQSLHYSYCAVSPILVFVFLPPG